jgi:small subunit ribosomal protein S6
MPTYETIFAVPSVLSEEEVSGSVKTIEDMIAEAGGSLNLSESMGERKMAYNVKGYERAYYHLIQFECPPETIEGFKKYYNINTNTYIRNMIVKI